MIRPGQTVTSVFTVRNNSGLVDAVSLPQAVALRNGVEDGTVEVAMTQRSTGKYTLSFTVPESYEREDLVQVEVTATVDDRTDSDVLFEDFVGELGLFGTSNVTLTFLDSDGDPVPLVDFAVFRQGSGRATVDGVATFGLPDGIYTVSARPTLGVLFVSTELTVNGDTALTITGTSAVIPEPPDDVQLCRVYGYQTQNGSPVEGTRIQVKLIGLPITSGATVFEQDLQVTHSDGNGYWQFDLLREQTYHLTIQKSEIRNFPIVIPDEEVYNITSFL